MKLSGGAYLPDDETDQVMLGAGLRYQSPKLQKALQHCKQARTAIDIGAHCGLWTYQLAQYFQRVEAFEPLQRHIECWRKNAGWKQSNILHEMALGEEERVCGMHLVEGSSGRSYIDGGGDLRMKRLDDFGFQDVDFVKVDVEGYELFVLKGATQTLLKWKPVLVVEQKPKLGSQFGLSDTAAVEYMKSLGWKVVDEIVGDYIMTWSGDVVA